MSVRVLVVRCASGLSGAEKVRTQRAAAAAALARLGLADPERDAEGVPRPTRGVYWSASHTEGAAGAACAPFAVGLDLERARALRPELVARFLSPGEPALEPLVAWTAKEALLKKTGLGLAGLARCRIVAERGARALELELDGAPHEVELARRGALFAALSHDGGPDASVEWEWDT